VQRTIKRKILSKNEQENAMKKWLTTTLLAAAIAYPAALAQAQPAPGQPAPGQLPPAPAPDAPQPANDGDEDNAPEVRDDDGQIRDAKEEAKRQLELELRNLAQGQRALAVARAQLGEGAAGELARLRLAQRGKTEKAAWLGVSTSKVPPALRHHAKLKNKYVGLVVERVEPSSPADEAGLEQFDIIEKVNDQWIVNTEQFSVVLRMQEPGKEVELAIIREGQPQTLKVKLAEKELPVLGQGEFGFIDVVPGAAVAGANQIFQVAPQGGVIFRHGQFEPLLELERLNKADDAQVTVKDDDHTLKVTTKKGKRHLVASDANGVVIYDGPINTEEDIANLPEEIREKVEKFDDVPGFRTTIKASKQTPATAPATERD
jgi:hypothetical protein